LIWWAECAPAEQQRGILKYLAVIRADPQSPTKVKLMDHEFAQCPEKIVAVGRLLLSSLTRRLET